MRPQRRTPATQRLTSKVLEDDTKLAAAVDEFIRTDEELRANAVDLTVAQARLRSLVGAEGWAAYLAIDELSTTRLADAAVKIAQWSYDEGTRHRRGR